MSLDAMRWAFQQTNLRSSVKFVLVALADRADSRGECFPSIRQIVADTNLNKETVCSATVELEKAGLLVRTKRYGGSVVYRLIGVPDRHSIPENRNSGKPESSIPENRNHSIPENRKLTTIEPTNEPKERGRFTPPTLAEVSGYAAEAGLRLNPEAFHAYYESNGWLVGKVRMKDWKAAARGWSSREKSNGVTANPTGAGGRSSAAGRVREACERERARLAAEGHN